MRTFTIIIPSPADFNFWRTVYSHGWCALPPFLHNPDRRQLACVLRLKDRTIVQCLLTGKARSVIVEGRSDTKLSAAHRSELTGLLRTCLRLDEDLSVFHRASRKYPGFRWIGASKSGRMLRAPTVFEDVVKMICTTNCTWALTT